MEERELTRALRQGNRQALRDVMETYTPYLSTVVWRVLGAYACREDVEEILSDAFLSLWHHREDLDPSQGVKAYVTAIARNRATDRLRAGRPQAVPLSDRARETGPGPEEEVERRMFAAALNAAVESLPPVERALVEGYYFEGKKGAALGKELGLTVQAVYTRLHRARTALKHALVKEGLTYGTER